MFVFQVRQAFSSMLQLLPEVLYGGSHDGQSLPGRVGRFDLLRAPQRISQVLQIDRSGFFKRPRHIRDGVPQVLASQLASLLQSRQPAYPDRIASRLGERIQFLDLDQVTHFFAKDKLTYAATKTKNYAVGYTISDLEQKLNPKQFCRIHRSTLLNLAYVLELDAWFEGRVLARLKDEKRTELQVSRDRVQELKRRLGV